MKKEKPKQNEINQKKKKNSDYNKFLVIKYKIGIICDDDVTLPIGANLIVLP